MSLIRLTSRRQPVKCGSSTCSSGKSHERPDVHARSSHLDQAGIHQQLDPGALQRPGKLA